MDDDGMTELAFLAGSLTILLGLLVSLTLWSRENLVIRAGALALGAFATAVGVLAFVHLLGVPKPAKLEWWHAAAEEATVVGTVIDEGRAVYLWLMLEGVEEPRAYVLPWNRDLAEQLQAARRDADRDQSTVRMRLPFERSLEDREPMFYALPQPAPPAKAPAAPPAQVVEQDA